MIATRTAVRGLVVVVGVGLGLAACHSAAEDRAARAEQAQIEARARELAQKIVADIEEQEHASDELRRIQDRLVAQTQLLATPDQFFETSGLRMLVRGDQERPLRSVQELSLTNKSRYPVSQIAARAEFVLEGEVVASVPLMLRGGLPAGATRRFAVADDTLASAAVQTTASETKIVITAVSIEPPPQVATP